MVSAMDASSSTTRMVWGGAGMEELFRLLRAISRPGPRPGPKPGVGEPGSLLKAERHESLACAALPLCAPAVSRWARVQRADRVPTAHRDPDPRRPARHRRPGALPGADGPRPLDRLRASRAGTDLRQIPLLRLWHRLAGLRPPRQRRLLCPAALQPARPP